MSKYNREIEKKFVLLTHHEIDMVDAELAAVYNPWNTLRGVSTDTFWKSPNVDFIRYRANTRELTFKLTDGETIVDRAEENLNVDFIANEARDYGDDLDLPLRRVKERVEGWGNAVFGEKVGTLTKDYRVFYCDGFVLSLYTVDNNPTIYLEVEADTLATVNLIAEQLNELFELRQEMRSLFQIIFGGQK